MSLSQLHRYDLKKGASSLSKDPRIKEQTSSFIFRLLFVGPFQAKQTFPAIQPGHCTQYTLSAVSKESGFAWFLPCYCLHACVCVEFHWSLPTTKVCWHRKEVERHWKPLQKDCIMDEAGPSSNCNSLRRMQVFLYVFALAWVCLKHICRSLSCFVTVQYQGRESPYTHTRTHVL